MLDEVSSPSALGRVCEEWLLSMIYIIFVSCFANQPCPVLIRNHKLLKSGFGFGLVRGAPIYWPFVNPKLGIPIFKVL